jgi:hypothetical protein
MEDARLLATNRQGVTAGSDGAAAVVGVSCVPPASSLRATPVLLAVGLHPGATISTSPAATTVGRVAAARARERACSSPTAARCRAPAPLGTAGPCATSARSGIETAPRSPSLKDVRPGDSWTDGVVSLPAAPP